MRKLLVRLTLWLVRVLDVDVIGRSRIRNGSDAVVRGARWEAFLREEGGLADMLDQLRARYVEGAGKCAADDTAKLFAMGFALRVADDLESLVVSVVQNGKIEAERIKQAERDAAARAWRGTV